MGKFRGTQDTTKTIREGRSMILLPPENATPPPKMSQDELRAFLANPTKKAGPWKWWSRCSIIKTNTVEATDKEGNEIERWDCTFQIDESEAANPGRPHTEFLRLREAADDGTYDKMTNYSLGTLDQIVQATLGEYATSDEGEDDYSETFEDGLTGVELNVKFKVTVDKYEGEYRTNCNAVEFSPVE